MLDASIEHTSANIQSCVRHFHNCSHWNPRSIDFDNILNNQVGCSEFNNDVTTWQSTIVKQRHLNASVQLHDIDMLPNLQRTKNWRRLFTMRI